MASAVATTAALLAGGAWLRARLQLDYDYTLIRGILKSQKVLDHKQKHDRLNIFLILESHAQNTHHADRPFLVFEDRSWTYRQAYDIVLKHGDWLKVRHGVKKGDVVAMDFTNVPTFLWLWLGIWSQGAVPAFINHNITARPLVHCIKQSGARLVLVEDSLRSRFTTEVENFLKTSEPGEADADPCLVFFDDAIETEIACMERRRAPDSTFQDLEIPGMAILMFTSGTTGLPKAAIISWRKLWTGCSFFTYWCGMRHTDRFYTVMPMFHGTASILGLVPVLAAGATYVLGHKFGTKSFWQDVRKHDVTIIQYVGEACRYLLAAPPAIDPETGANLDRVHNVRMALGNGLRPDVWDRFKERFGIETIGEFFAATEAPLAWWNFSSNRFSSGAVGRNGFLLSLLSGATHALVEVDWDTESPKRDPRTGRCVLVRTNESGELLFKLKADDVRFDFQGYYNNEAANEKKIIRNVRAEGDIYFRTGDVLRCDSDGRWFFCDRIGDTFRWKSQNVSTAEVSDTLGLHPAVVNVNVYGVEVPHHDGRIGCAAVLLRSPDPQQRRSDDTKEARVISVDVLRDLARHAKTNLPSYAVPGFLRVVSEVTSTGNHKQVKTGLRNEGIDLKRVGGDLMFWLRNGAYVPFGESDWAALNSGSEVMRRRHGWLLLRITG